MQNKPNKILVYIIVALMIIGLGAGGYYIYKKYLSSKSVSTIINNSNLSGKLFGPTGAQKAENLDPDQIIYWTNKYRADNSLPALTKNILLTQAAEAKVTDMAEKQYFEHVSPDGVSPSELVKSMGYDYKVTGENLALGDFKNEKALVDAWMASPGHRANILSTDYSEIGVYSGLENFEDRGKTWLSVQEFGYPQPDCPKPDAEIQSEIDTKKAEYNDLVNQINDLKQEIDDLKKEKGSNSEINQKIDEYNALLKQAESLNLEIENLVTDYNAEVSEYNTCITH